MLDPEDIPSIDDDDDRGHVSYVAAGWQQQLPSLACAEEPPPLWCRRLDEAMSATALDPSRLAPPPAPSLAGACDEAPRPPSHSSSSPTGSGEATGGGGDRYGRPLREEWRGDGSLAAVDFPTSADSVTGFSFVEQEEEISRFLTGVGLQAAGGGEELRPASPSASAFGAAADGVDDQVKSRWGGARAATRDAAPRGAPPEAPAPGRLHEGGGVMPGAAAPREERGEAGVEAQDGGPWSRTVAMPVQASKERGYADDQDGGGWWSRTMATPEQARKEAGYLYETPGASRSASKDRWRGRFDAESPIVPPLPARHPWQTPPTATPGRSSAWSCAPPSGSEGAAVTPAQHRAEPLEETPSAELRLVACGSCGRRFREDRLPVHEDICRSVSASGRRRHAFESQRQRTKDAIGTRWWLKDAVLGGSPAQQASIGPGTGSASIVPREHVAPGVCGATSPPKARAAVPTAEAATPAIDAGDAAAKRRPFLRKGTGACSRASSVPAPAPGRSRLAEAAPRPKLPQRPQQAPLQHPKAPPAAERRGKQPARTEVAQQPPQRPQAPRKRASSVAACAAPTRGSGGQAARPHSAERGCVRGAREEGSPLAAPASRRRASSVAACATPTPGGGRQAARPHSAERGCVRSAPEGSPPLPARRPRSPFRGSAAGGRERSRGRVPVADAGRADVPRSPAVDVAPSPRPFSPITSFLAGASPARAASFGVGGDAGRRGAGAQGDEVAPEQPHLDAEVDDHDAGRGLACETSASLLPAGFGEPAESAEDVLLKVAQMLEAKYSDLAETSLLPKRDCLDRDLFADAEGRSSADLGTSSRSGGRRRASGDASREPSADDAALRCRSVEPARTPPPRQRLWPGEYDDGGGRENWLMRSASPPRYLDESSAGMDGDCDVYDDTCADAGFRSGGGGWGLEASVAGRSDDLGSMLDSLEMQSAMFRGHLHECARQIRERQLLRSP